MPLGTRTAVGVVWAMREGDGGNLKVGDRPPALAACRAPRCASSSNGSRAGRCRPRARCCAWRCAGRRRSSRPPRASFIPRPARRPSRPTAARAKVLAALARGRAVEIRLGVEGGRVGGRDRRVRGGRRAGGDAAAARSHRARAGPGFRAARAGGRSDRGRAAPWPRPSRRARSRLSCSKASRARAKRRFISRPSRRRCARGGRRW